MDDAKVAEQLADQQGRVRKRLSSVRRKLLVMSGKGGVGKSAVTSQLALALARRGDSAGILDADLNGPCIHRMLGLSGRRTALEPGGAVPETGPLGVKVASLAFLTGSEGVRWQGPSDLSPVWLGIMEAGVLREMLSDTSWGELDTLLFDLPPGAAADKPPALLSLVPDLGGALVVTTPSLVAQEVVRRSVLYARGLGIQMLGLVENMAGPSPENAGRLSSELELPLLARIPLDCGLAQSLDSGEPLPAGHPVSLLFDALAKELP